MARGVSEIEDDKLRILLTLIQKLSLPASMWCHRHPDAGGIHVSFRDKRPKAGDLVVCVTSGIHDWTVAIVEHPTADGAMLREIGSDRLCKMGNESFTVITGLHPEDLYEGEQRAFYSKLLKAFHKHGDDWHVYGGLEFDGDTAVVTVRERWGGLGKDSTPYELQLPWKELAGKSVKKLADAMKAAGWMEKQFRLDAGMVPHGPACM